MDALKRGGENAKAVLPMHYGGQCVDMPALQKISRAHNLIVIGDACHALGATYGENGQKDVAVGACAHSDMTAFSLHPVKAIAMGEGGVVTTNDPALYDRLCRFRNHGMVKAPDEFHNPDLGLDETGAANPWYYEMPELGMNYRAGDINCALGLSQLSKLDRFMERRRSLAARYGEQLGSLAPLVVPMTRVAKCQSAFHLYPVLVDFERLGFGRAELMKRLTALGIGSQVHYVPVHLQPYYSQRYGDLSLPGAESYYQKTLSLPLFPAMDDTDVDRVVAALKDMLGVS